MKINEYKLDSWIYLSSGWEVLEDSHTTYNTTVCSGVSPSNTHSAYVHLCVLIFFCLRRANSASFPRRLVLGYFWTNGVWTGNSNSSRTVQKADLQAWYFPVGLLLLQPFLFTSLSSFIFKPLTETHVNITKIYLAIWFWGFNFGYMTKEQQQNQIINVVECVFLLL